MSKQNKSHNQGRPQVPVRSAPPVQPVTTARPPIAPKPAPVMIDEAPLIDPADLDDIEPKVEPLVDPADEPKKLEAPVDPDRELSLHELNEISKRSAEQARKSRYENKTEAELIVIRAEDEANRIIVQARHQANAIIAQAQAAVANLQK